MSLLRCFIAIALVLCGITQASAATQEKAQRDLYLLHCAGCHRPHGYGALPEVPGLHDELGYMVQVEGGRDYMVRVPGAAQSPISDVELQTIVNWMLLEFNADTLPDDFVPLSLTEVRQARANVLADPLRYRTLLMQRVEARFGPISAAENPGGAGF